MDIEKLRFPIGKYAPNKNPDKETIQKWINDIHTFPNSLIEMLNQKAKELSIPKNKIIEMALSIYFEQLKKAEYIKSYKQMADDTDLLRIAEEGMEEYMSQLAEEDK